MFKKIDEKKELDALVSDPRWGVYKKYLKDHFKSDDNGSFFEVFGTVYYRENGYHLIAENFGKKHGFDGLFLNDANELFFYESKYKENASIKVLVDSAMKTVNNNPIGRISEINMTTTNMSTVIDNNLAIINVNLIDGHEKIKTVKNNLINSLDRLDGIAKNIIEKKPLNITEPEVLLMIAHKNTSLNNSPKSAFKEVVDIEIKKP